MLRTRLLGLVVVFLPGLGCNSLPGTDPTSLASPVAPPSPEPGRPHTAHAYLARAQALEKTGHEAEAIEAYEQARQLNPYLTHITRRLAVLYERRGDARRALAEYRLALEAAPLDPDLLNDVGYFHYQHQDWAEAEQCFRRALKSNPNDGRAWINLGLVLAHEERYQESCDALSRIVDPAEAPSNLGVLLAKHGRTDEARRALAQALAVRPELSQGRAVSAWLERPRPISAESPEP